MAIPNWSVDDNFEWVKWSFSVSSQKDYQLVWFIDFGGDVRGPRAYKSRIVSE